MFGNGFGNLPPDINRLVYKNWIESIKEDKQKYRARRLCFEYRGRISNNKDFIKICERFSISTRDNIEKALVELVCAEFQRFFQPDEDDVLNRSAAACLDHEFFWLECVAPGYEPASHEACYGCYWGSLIRIKSLDKLHVIELMTETKDDRGNIEGRIKYWGPEKFKTSRHLRSWVPLE